MSADTKPESDYLPTFDALLDIARDAALKFGYTQGNSKPYHENYKRDEATMEAALQAVRQRYAEDCDK